MQHTVTQKTERKGTLSSWRVASIALKLVFFSSAALAIPAARGKERPELSVKLTVDIFTSAFPDRKFPEPFLELLHPLEIPVDFKGSTSNVELIAPIQCFRLDDKDLTPVPLPTDRGGDIFNVAKELLGTESPRARREAYVKKLSRTTPDPRLLANERDSPLAADSSLARFKDSKVTENYDLVLVLGVEPTAFDKLGVKHPDPESLRQSVIQQALVAEKAGETEVKVAILYYPENIGFLQVAPPAVPIEWDASAFAKVLFRYSEASRPTVTDEEKQRIADLQADTSPQFQLYRDLVKRQPLIDKLRLSGALGEQSDGYAELQAASQGESDERLLVGENNDRKALFERISDEENGRRDFITVGRDLASEFASSWHAAVWRQTPEGDYYNDSFLAQILTKKGAELRDSIDGVVVEKLLPYEHFYVLEESNGWLRVSMSKSERDVAGWILKRSTMRWDNTQCLRYRPLISRKPVLFFDDPRLLESSLIRLTSDERYRRFQELFLAVESESKEYAYGLKACEPFGKAVKDGFQGLLPILEVNYLAGSDPETRILKVYAETSKDASPPVIAEDWGIDIRFVVDTTGSMGPFIEAVEEALSSCVARLGSEASFGRLQFGVIGYRDDPSIPNVEYHTKLFGGTALRSGQDFLPILGQVTVPAEETSDDYPEDVFTGMRDAVTSDGWHDRSIRLVVLIGDASGNLPGSRGNLSQYGAVDVRNDANAERVYIAAVHIRDGQHIDDHPIAEEQYRVMANNSLLMQQAPGNHATSDPVYYYAIDHLSPSDLSTYLSDLIYSARSQIRRSSSSESDPAPNVRPVGPKLGSKNERLFNNAYLTLLESQGKSTNTEELEAWTVDWDFGTNPPVKPFDVCVLLTERELKEAISFYDGLSRALTISVSVDSFLREWSRTTGQLLMPAQSIGDQSPMFLSNLPYKPEIITLTPAELQVRLKATSFQDQLKRNLPALRDHLKEILTEAPMRLNAVEALKKSQYVYSVPIDLFSLWKDTN